MRRSHLNKVLRLSSDKQVLDNLSAHMGKGESVSIGGKKFFAHDIEAVFKERVDVTDAVPPTKAQYQAAVQAERDTLARTDPLAEDLRQALLIHFRDQPDVLAVLGLARRKKRGPMTGPEAVAAAAKAKATRERRTAPAAAAPPAPIAPVAPANGPSGAH